MATCKDCLHYEICEEHASGNLLEIVNADWCVKFKDRSKYVEQKRGVWKHREYNDADGSDDYYYCSECHETALSEHGRYTHVKSDYCPNCGAKMGATDTNVGSK